MILDKHRTSHQSFSSSIANHLPLRKRNRTARPATTSSFCEEIAHYPVFNPRDPRHNPTASSSWLQSDYYQPESFKSQSSIRWMQELPRRSLRKAKSGFLALRSGIQRRPLPDSMGHIGEIPNIWSSTDSTGDSSDQFPSSVSDASTEDDGEFGTGLYRAVRNHSLPLNPEIESDCLKFPSAIGLICGPSSEDASQGSLPTVRQESAISDPIFIKADDGALNPEMSSPMRLELECGNRTIEELSTPLEPASRFLSLPSPSCVVGPRATQVTGSVSSQNSSNSHLTCHYTEKTKVPLQIQVSDISSLEQSKPNAAGEVSEPLGFNREARHELSHGDMADLFGQTSRLGDASSQIVGSSCSLRNSSVVSPRQSSVPQITGIQFNMEPLQLFPRRDFSSGDQTLCCSDTTDNHYPSQETSIGYSVNCVTGEDIGESAYVQNSSSKAGEAQANQVDTGIIEALNAIPETLEADDASAGEVLSIVKRSDMANIHDGLDSLKTERTHSPCHTGGISASEIASESNSWSPIENEILIPSFSFRDEIFFVDGKSSDIRPDRGDNPTKTERRIVKDGSIYNGPGLDRDISIRTQDIPEIIGPGRSLYRMHDSRAGGLLRFDRTGSDSTDDCLVTYPIWERRQFP